MSSEFLILMVVLAYFLVSLWIGISLSSRMKTSSDYFKGGGALPWWAAGLSQYMAGFSSYAFVVVAGVVYSKGLFGLLWSGLSPLVIFIGALWFGPKWRRARIKTPVQYLARRYNPATRQIFSWIGLTTRPLGNGMRLATFGILITAMLGWDRSATSAFGLTLPMLIVIAGGSVVVLYTMLGGLFGAVVIDMIQCIILQIALIPLVFLSINAVGGWSAFMESVPQGFVSLPAFSSSDWLWLSAWFIIFFADYNGGQWGLISRYASTRSEKDARKAGILSAVIYIPLILCTALPVLAARALYPEIHSESSFGWIVQGVLPPGLVALVVAAMFSATLSTISAELNTLAAIFAVDIFKGKFFPNLSDKFTIITGRLATLTVGFITIMIALLILKYAGTIFSLAQQLASYVVIPVAIPLLLGLVSRRGTSNGVIIAICLGIPSAWVGRQLGLYMYLSESSAIFFQVTFVVVVTLAGFILGSVLVRTDPEEIEKAENFHKAMQKPSLPTSATGVFAAPLGLIGNVLIFNATIILLTLISPLNHGRPIPIVMTALALILVGIFFKNRARHKKILVNNDA